MDVICAQCGEPWEYYGIFHGDFEEEDIESFLRGEGCPCCSNPAQSPGHFDEQHWHSLLEATDDPDVFIKYLPL